jgi:uncharacterized membrane protein YtjA (UPF0391 family)
MREYAVILFMVALVAALLGFCGLAAATTGVAGNILFAVFTLVGIALLMGMLHGRI